MESAEFDLNEFLEDLLNDAAGEVFTDTLDGLEVQGGVDKQAAKTPAPPPKDEFKDPEPRDIDPRLSESSTMTLIKAEIKRKRLAGHHIDSMDTFYSTGIKQIVTKIFAISGHMRNDRDKTEDDKEISEISYEVKFTDINLAQPQTTKFKSGEPQMMTRSMARTRNLTYSAPMTMDTTISVTAHMRNGDNKTRTATITNQRIGSIPCLAGSFLDPLTGCSRETMKQLEEDPNDPGGYFIIKGAEWCINSLENITMNSFHVRKNAYQNEVCRGTFISKPGDTFENSYQLIVRYLNSGAITVEVTTGKFEKFEIPYYIIFRIFGISRDRDIVNHIVYGVNNTDPVTRQMLMILAKSFEAEDGKFGSIRKSTDVHEIIAYIAQRITEANSIMAKKDDNAAKYLNTNFLLNMDRFLLPHVGGGPEHRIKKLRFLAHLINKLLAVHMGVVDPVDTDNYKNKRVLAAGSLMAKIFKTNFNLAVVQEIRKHLVKEFKSTPFSLVHLDGLVRLSVNSDQLERLLVQAITTGNKITQVGRKEIVNRVSSQALYRKNDMNMFSTLGTINVSSGGASKANERADLVRRPHQSGQGYVDVSQSADTGEDVGMTRQMAATCSISHATSSYVLRKILSDDPEVIPEDDVVPQQVHSQNLAKIFVNGDIIGYCKSSFAFAARYRARRRHGMLHYLTSIVCEPLVREVYFHTDVGRMMRPLLIVYNNITEYKEKWRAGDRTIVFKQWILLTAEHIDGLRTGKITMDDLRDERVLEYIAPEEQENTYQSPNIDTLRTQVNSLQHQYTHCDIDQSILGIVTLAAPCANHSNTVRNTMYTNHRKQSSAWPTTSYPFRIEKNSILQHYCELPLVSTISDSLTYPNGQNTIVALIMHGGDNCEDSLKVNQTSIDCGAFNASVYNYEKAELDKGEQFGNPDYARTLDMKKNANYGFIDKGFIAEGTLVQKDYVLIVRTAKIPKPVDQFLFIDKSIVYRRDEPVYIERVVQTRNAEDTVIVKVKWRADRPLGVGDKLCMTDDHDVLTSRGWVPINKVTTADYVACREPGGTFSYLPPTATHAYDHCGKMYLVHNPRMSAMVTLDHKMLCANPTDTNFSLRPAAELLHKPIIYCNTGVLAVTSAISDTTIDLTMTKFPLPQYVWSLSQKQCRRIIENTPVLITGDTAAIDDYMRLAFHCGWSTYAFVSGGQHTLVLNKTPGIYVNYHGDKMHRMGIEDSSDPRFASIQDDCVVDFDGAVYCLTVPTGVFLVRRNNTVWWTGNSSRTGNKGLVANAIPRSDMPYTESGLVPDIVGNPLSIPTRMAVNQIIETVLGWVASIYGTHIDATCFRKHDLDAALAFLEKNGIKNGGHERLYNGKTGLWLDTLIFIGPTTYQRLQKFVIDEHYATRGGPSSAITRQPLDGKNNDGGLRIGEMEKDVFCAQGNMRALGEKFYKDSDGNEIFVCRRCKTRAAVNEKLSIYKCQKCGDLADISSVRSCWSANLLLTEINAMNYSTELELEPHIYPEMETD